MKKTICCGCGAKLADSELCLFRNEFYCEECLDEITFICGECGERILREDDVGNDDIVLCQGCRDNHYYTCSECGVLVREDQVYTDNGYDYCHFCYENLEDSVIEDYSYKPCPVFHGNADRYFGVELELDEGGESSDNAAALMDIANASTDNIYIKHDGSLNEGFEIVTHPMSLYYHQKEMPWQSILDKAIFMGYTSHKAKTCGLHVHVNRASLGADTEMQEACISRILFFVEKHWEELLKFSRRTEIQLNRWAHRYGYKPNAKELLYHAKTSNLGRYACINLQNHATIEFRIFRGTLKYNTLIATLQMVEKICDVAFLLSDDEMEALSWTSFVEQIDVKAMPELVCYLKERRIYINEPILTEEDE